MTASHINKSEIIVPWCFGCIYYYFSCFEIIFDLSGLPCMLQKRDERNERFYIFIYICMLCRLRNPNRYSSSSSSLSYRATLGEGIYTDTIVSVVALVCMRCVYTYIYCLHASFRSSFSRFHFTPFFRSLVEHLSIDSTANLCVTVLAFRHIHIYWRIRLNYFRVVQAHTHTRTHAHTSSQRSTENDRIERNETTETKKKDRNEEKEEEEREKTNDRRRNKTE